VPHKTHVNLTEKKHKHQKTNTNKDVNITMKQDKSERKNIFAIIFKTLFTLIFIIILIISSLSVLLAYDIINYENKNITDMAKNIVLKIPFMPKTSDYILESVPKTLLNTPLETTIEVITIKPDQTADLNFNIKGNVVLNPESETSTVADLILKQRENELQQIIYIDNSLYIKVTGYNFLVQNFLKEMVNYKANSYYSGWHDNGNYKIPYIEIAKAINKVSSTNRYYNRNAGTIRIRLEGDTLKIFNSELKQLDYSQLTKNIESAVITIYLTKEQESMSHIEITAITKEKGKYIINITIDKVIPFEIKSPMVN